MKAPHLHSVESSHLQGLGWHEGDLFVRFSGGRVYRYHNVPKEIFDKGMASDSKGRWFRDQVRGHFVHQPYEMPRG